MRPLPLFRFKPPRPRNPPAYQRPTGEETLHDIVADSLGPHSLTLNLFTAAIHPLHDD